MQFSETKIIVVRQFAIPAYPTHLSVFESLLSYEEKKRASSFLREQDSWRFIFCRGMLRLFLGKQGEMDPRAIAFSYSTLGKPFLMMKSGSFPLYFNLSHTEDYLSIVGTLQTDVGIDVERIRSLPHWMQITERYFSCEESQYILEQSEQNSMDAFFHCWTRKEALLKGWGIGVGKGLERIQQQSCLASSIEGWSLETLASREGYKLGLAYRGKDLPIENQQERWENYL